MAYNFDCCIQNDGFLEVNDSYVQCASNKSSAVAEMGDRRHNRHGHKGEGGAVPLSRSAGNPSRLIQCDKCPVRRSTSVPSGVLIHPAVWPQ